MSSASQPEMKDCKVDMSGDDDQLVDEILNELNEDGIATEVPPETLENDLNTNLRNMQELTENNPAHMEQPTMPPMMDIEYNSPDNSGTSIKNLIKKPIIVFCISFIIFNNNLRLIVFLYNFLNNYVFLYTSILKYFWKMFVKPYYVKLKFQGKGYYLYKNTRNTITPQFGYSHRFYIYSFFLCVKFITKTTLILFGTNYSTIKSTTTNIFM